MKAQRSFVLTLLALVPASACAHLFHPGVEPPPTQLSRDYVIIKILLKDPRNYLEQIRGIYDGSIKIPPPVRSRAWLAKRPEHIMVFRGAARISWSAGSLRREVQRLDGAHGTSLGLRIDHAMAESDRDAIEIAFRDMFTVLVHELLEGVAKRADDAPTALRLYQQARRYYSDALEANLVLNDSNAASLANLALEGMARALGNEKTRAPAAPEAFERYRRRFMHAVEDSQR